MNRCAFVLLLCITNVYGATFMDRIKTDIVNGKVVRYCETRQMRFSPGTVFQDYSTCLDCTCMEDGLSCHTMAGAARITVPDGSQCISKIVNCKNRWVMRNNENEGCPTNLIPKHISMVGK